MQNVRRMGDEYLVIPLLRSTRMRCSKTVNLISALLGLALGITVSVPVILKTEPLPEVKAPAVYPIPYETQTLRHDLPDVISRIPVISIDIKQLAKEQQSAPAITPTDELTLFAKCVEAEASGEGLEGKRLVADVILNRVASPLFPGKTITDVILQHNAATNVWQFSVAGNGMLERAAPSEETWQAIQMEMQDISCPGILYFTSEGYSPYGTPWQKVGNHYFSTAK